MDMNEQRLTNTLEEIKSVAQAVLFYGMETTGICDLTETASENLGLDWHDDENETLIEEEMKRLEDNARDAVIEITDAIDSILPLSSLNDVQIRKLDSELGYLGHYGVYALNNVAEFTKLIIASFALHDDTNGVDNLKYAIENALEAEDDEDD